MRSSRLTKTSVRFLRSAPLVFFLRLVIKTSDSTKGWISREITYGLYLSDHTILNDIETELVVLAGIMIQNLHHETAWHLRGSRRVGMSAEDVEAVQQCVSVKPIPTSITCSWSIFSELYFKDRSS